MKIVMTRTTKTLNPLPFQDLEPKRFEDLVRQLVYDLRVWRRLEATGRAGGDDGFDVRGFEIVASSVQQVASEPEIEEEEAIGPTDADRLWLIQCKREKAISPATLAIYLNEIVLTGDEILHGVIFVAACNFSKRSRDVFLAWCRERKISEAHIWGRGELEDMLFQPKNDNLLFAYFGISLQIRKRSVATQLRATTAIKRKLKRHVSGSSAEILIRDPEASEYPYSAENVRPEQWVVYRPEEMGYDGLRVSLGWFYASVDSVTGEWDAAMRLYHSNPDTPWVVHNKEEDRLRKIASDWWNSLPEDRRGWLKVTGVIPYKAILEVDEMGDDVFEGVHIFASFRAIHGPFLEGYYLRLGNTRPYSSDWSVDDSKRINLAPRQVRLRQKEKRAQK